MTYINHITLSTGHLRRSPRSEVPDETLALLRPWLDAALKSEVPIPLPADELAHYSAIAIHEIGLVVTVYAPAGPHLRGKPHQGDNVPIATFGVATRSRESAPLWEKLEKHFSDQQSTAPETPWCAVVLHDNLIAFADAQEWLGDFERCISWAWLTRREGAQ